MRPPFGIGTSPYLLIMLHKIKFLEESSRAWSIALLKNYNRLPTIAEMVAVRLAAKSTVLQVLSHKGNKFNAKQYCRARSSHPR